MSGTTASWSTTTGTESEPRASAIHPHMLLCACPEQRVLDPGRAPCSGAHPACGGRAPFCMLLHSLGDRRCPLLLLTRLLLLLLPLPLPLLHRCGMRYHADPLYGCWTPRTAVVSLGDTRTFVFREANDHNTR